SVCFCRELREGGQTRLHGGRIAERQVGRSVPVAWYRPARRENASVGQNMNLFYVKVRHAGDAQGAERVVADARIGVSDERSRPNGSYGAFKVQADDDLAARVDRNC